VLWRKGDVVIRLRKTIAAASKQRCLKPFEGNARCLPGLDFAWRGAIFKVISKYGNLGYDFLGPPASWP